MDKTCISHYWASFPDGDDLNTTQLIDLRTVIGIKYVNEEQRCLIRLNNGNLVPLAIGAETVIEEIKSRVIRHNLDEILTNVCSKT
jgi:hypothetical protein